MDEETGVGTGQARETPVRSDEVAILSASGTAVLLNPVADRELSSGARHADKRAPDPGSGKVSADR